MKRSRVNGALWLALFRRRTDENDHWQGAFRRSLAQPRGKPVSRRGSDGTSRRLLTSWKSKSIPAPDGEGLKQLKMSARDGRLVAVVGTGISMALTDSRIPAPSWKGLVKHGFDYGATKGKIMTKYSARWKSQIDDSDDIDNLLGAAEFMGRKLDAPSGVLYARWLESVFKYAEPSKNQMARAICALLGAGIPFYTLNYDQLLEQVRN